SPSIFLPPFSAEASGPAAPGRREASRREPRHFLAAPVRRHPPAAPAGGLGAVRRPRLGGRHHGRGRHRPLPRQAGPLDRPLGAERAGRAGAGGAAVDGLPEAPLRAAALARGAGRPLAWPVLVARLSGVGPSGVGAPP